MCIWCNEWCADSSETYRRVTTSSETVCRLFWILPLIKHSEHVLIRAARHGSEEQSRRHVRVRAAQGVQERAQSAPPTRAAPVHRPHVLVKRALSLPLQRLDVVPTLQLRHWTRTQK